MLQPSQRVWVLSGAFRTWGFSRFSNRLCWGTQPEASIWPRGVGWGVGRGVGRWGGGSAAMVTRVRTGPAGQPRRRRITCHARPDERGWRCVPMATGFGQRWPLQQPAAPAGSTPVSRGHSACGQEVGLAGGGVAARLGEATRAGQTAPESRGTHATTGPGCAGCCCPLAARACCCCS